LKLEATYVSASEFDDRYFEVSFDRDDHVDFDLLAPMKPCLLIQRPLEDDDALSVVSGAMES
jgi:hypothetical protein